MNLTKYAVNVTVNCNYSCLPKKLAIFQIYSAQYFQYSSHQSPSGSHVFHGEIMYTYSTAAWTRPKYAVFVALSPAITEFRKILWKHRNSVEMGKFRDLAQNSVFCGKLWSLLICMLRCMATFFVCIAWQLGLVKGLKNLVLNFTKDNDQLLVNFG